MALTGRPGAPPPGPPAGLVPKLAAVAELLADRAAALGGRLMVDPLARLAERAAIAGFERQGDVSCGGATRLLPACPGWLAVTLARPDDVDAVPAWLELDRPPTDVWTAVATAVANRPVDELVERAALLGLAVGRLPEGPPPPAGPGLPLTAVSVPGPAAPARPLAGLVVIDLGSLWAGPLCTSLLAEAGADVIKVESLNRPDGARQGPAAFFARLNAGKRSVALDLRAPDGPNLLREVLAHADVVVEASRPRALAQLGIDPLELLRSRTPRVWASITGHGRTGAGRDRVAFGDDAAVAGGLVTWDRARPCFCADAVADPTTGLVAAAGILDALARGGRWLLDVPMAGVAAHLAGPTLPAALASGPAAAPSAPAPRGRAPRLGEHTAAVLERLGVGS
jgi:hypothetical protein